MNRPSPDDMKAMGVMEYIQELEKENRKLKSDKSKLTKRIYKNIKGDMWREYQDYCNKNNI